MAHMWKSHGTHYSFLIEVSKVLHIWMSYGAHVNESWHTCERVMAHMWKSHGTHYSFLIHSSRFARVSSHTNESCCICEKVEEDTYRRHESWHNMWRGHESWHTCERVFAHMTPFWFTHLDLLVSVMNEHRRTLSKRCAYVTWFYHICEITVS